VGFKPVISAGEQPQTYALDRAATGTGFSKFSYKNRKKFYIWKIKNTIYLKYAYFENWGTKQERRRQYATVPPANNVTNSANFKPLTAATASCL
jgi:hypothetical protein